jgi:Putative zinc-finger
VPEHDHPDREQLAAFQAGDGDRRQRAEIEAHLAGCPSCAEMVASVGQARSRLALLEEPALPPGLHDRLAAAVEEEAARTAPDGQAPWYRRRPADRPHARPTPWYRRPVAWGAAAALLVAALVVPFLDRSGGDLTTAGGGGAADSAREAATASGAAGAIPVLRIPGEVTAAKIRAELATNSQAKAALDSAASGAQAAPRAGQGAGPATQSPAQGGSDRYGPSAPAPQAGTSSAPAPQAVAAALGPCLTAAVADPAIAPLRPAFFVQGTYRGREATILVTTSASQPGRVDLWVFPRDNCSAPPLATKRVR